MKSKDRMGKLIQGIFFFFSFIVVAQAGTELDRRYALESVGYLRAWDNVDGLFKDYVDRAYQEFFKNQSRFRIRDLKQADSILNRSKISYRSLIDDSKILAQVARKMRADSLVRTRVYKEGPHYRFVLEWLHSPKMNVLSKHSFISDDGTLGSSELDKKLKEGLRHMIAKVPFLGQVTGRDHDWVTINIGKNSGIRKGDVLVISTLQEAKIHPLLKQVVDWKFTKTGQIVIETVEDRLGFGKVRKEEPSQQISRYQKITKLIKRESFQSDHIKVEKNSDTDFDENFKPTIGFGEFGLWLGNVSRSYSSGTTTASGGGILLGFKADTQLWLTGNIWANLVFGYGFYSYSQALNGGSSASIGNGSITRVDLSMAYAFWLGRDFYGPKITTKFGYHKTSYGIPSSSTNFTGGTNVGSVYFGLGGELPLRGRYGILMNLELGLINSGQQLGFSAGSATNVTDVNFFIGGYYRWKKRMHIRVGLEVFSQGIEFSSTSEVTQRSVIFAPSLLYYL